MRHLTVILTQEACAVLVAHFHTCAFENGNPSTLLNHGQQYDYYRDHALKQGWGSITNLYPRRRHEACDQPVRLVG